MRGAGLIWARRFPGWPSRIRHPHPRRHSAKAQGLIYERQLAAALGPEAIHGQWWEFEDAEGHGFCQTDFIIEGSQGVLVIECKCSWIRDAHDKLDALYLPVVRLATGKPATGIVVSRAADGMAAAIRRAGAVSGVTLVRAARLAQAGKRTYLHWRPNDELWSSARRAAA